MADAGGEGGRRRRGRERDEGKKGRGKRPAGRGKGPDSNQRASLISAITHPSRRRILRALAERSEALSPAGLGRKLQLPPGALAYHFKVLQGLGAVRQVNERMVRGAVEHFYETTIEDDPPIEALLEETREADEESS